MLAHKLLTKRTVDLAADQLRAAILGGELEVGERLPPERVLAESLGINRQTLRAAIASLAAEGLLRARQGSGITVLDFRETGGVSLLPHLLESGELALLEPFLALRRAVASEAVAIACVRATEAELDALQALADRLSAESDLEALATGNLQFSRQLLRLARNLPMELLFNTVAEVYETRPELRGALAANADAVRASFPALVGLVRARDPDAARRAVRTVLHALDTVTLANLETT